MPSSEQTSPTASLATFAAELSYDSIPAPVIEHTKLCLLDTIGCGLFGTTLPWVRIVQQTVLATDETARAELWARGERVSVTNAALVNGMAIHAFELDDLHRDSIVHPGSVVVSAALAAARLRSAPVSGRSLLTAMVAGYEAAARVGRSMGAAHLVHGWHPTGTHGTFGAAVAAGSILGLNPKRMLNAMGTAGSQSSGLMSSQFSSMVKRYHAGHAAQAGLMSALLADRGFLGIPDILENPYGGYLSTFSPTSNPDLILSGLGEDWQIGEVGFKPYSTNGSCHPTIDALLDMRKHFGITGDDVAAVRIRCSTATFKHVGWSYQPESVTTAQMNLPYIVSVVLADGDAFVDQFSPERIVDPQLVDFSRRVTIEADPAIDAGGDAMRHATYLEVDLKDGRTLTDERVHAKGSADFPMSVNDVRAKFRKLARATLSERHIDRVEQVILAAEAATIDDLLALIE
ncbi:MmgE/PrpD family protein [Paramicrobacterium chengjingii]|uniref:MmgE/PrpD family protein n=1 Tax=Paramicrobacterium chengjingii TaxID=2769067 RepID=A0ABX6YI13_9MICO|nr:MmgE/PrpD family protein [Microbacterium chengjingii]QPZ38428.1 MmgE/PrpD family protein [Microbacterium chengjingii]